MAQIHRDTFFGQVTVLVNNWQSLTVYRLHMAMSDINRVHEIYVIYLKSYSSMAFLYVLVSPGPAHNSEGFPKMIKTLWISWESPSSVWGWKDLPKSYNQYGSRDHRINGDLTTDQANMDLEVTESIGISPNHRINVNISTNDCYMVGTFVDHIKPTTDART